MPADPLAATSKSAADRIAEGRRQRKLLSREAQSRLREGKRDFDPLDVLLASDAGRIERLLPIKYGRMAKSPFAFFRGSVAIMAADLGRLPHSRIDVQLCGDAHVQNLGSFATPDGRLAFDFNDFDQTIRGPWEWDVKRMAASIVLAGRQVKQSKAACAFATEAFLARYCESMAAFSSAPILDVARHQIQGHEQIKPVTAALRESERSTPPELLAKLTDPRFPDQWRFRTKRPLLWRVKGDEARQVRASLDPYRDSLRPEARHLFDLFQPRDAGFKVVGTGSVGLRNYVVIFEGNGPADPLFLQIKQEQPSAYAPFLSDGVNEHQGKRAAEGQRAIQLLSDPLLGWTAFAEHQFLVRQLDDHKGGIEIAKLRGDGLLSLAEVSGELMARGHARSGDACAIAGYCGNGAKIVRAIREFATRYADQAEKDFGKFQSAIERRRIKAIDVPD